MQPIEVGGNDLVVDAAALGPNRELVEPLLRRLAETELLDWAAAEPSMTALGVAISGLSVDGSAEQPARDLITDTRRLAEQLDPTMARTVIDGVNRAIAGYLEVHVPAAAHASTRALIEAAALWPAVFGAHANPFEAAVDLARHGVFPTLDSGERIMYHHQQLAWPVALPAPLPKPPVLRIVRTLDL